MTDILELDELSSPHPCEHDDRPIAVRRKRRASSTILSSPTKHTHSLRHGINTPPQTPQHKKRVRFSDPGPPIPATGLTPFIRRTSLGTPSSRRSSASSSGRWNLDVDDSPISGTLQFAPLRQVLEGRVKRRIRRNRLSEEVNIIELEKRDHDRIRRETESLRAQLREKDEEIACLRDEQDVASQIGEESGTPVTIPSFTTDKVHELQTQIARLRAELDKRDAEVPGPNWTMAARDPFDEDDDDEFMMGNNDGDPFANDNDDSDDFNVDASNIFVSTPTRRAPPSPPVTAPTTPSHTGSTQTDAIIQVSLPDPENAHLHTQLRRLESEVSTLSAAVEQSNTTEYRLFSKLTPHAPEADDLDSALDKVLTTLVLTQSTSKENGLRFAALAKEINALGLSSSPEESVSALLSQFRHARIELERLHPGETAAGFENSKLLDLLLSRIKVLTGRVEELDDDVDAYHEQELLLRQQLSGRIDVARAMELALNEQTYQVMTLTSSLHDSETSISRLSSSLESYRSEVSSLESLIEGLATKHSKDCSNLNAQIVATREDGDQRVYNEQLQRDVLLASYEGLQMLVQDLSPKYQCLVDTVVSLQVQIREKDMAAADHSFELALRESRITEVRSELERVNSNLRKVNETIYLLEAEKAGLEGQVKGERGRYEDVLEAVRCQLMGAIQTASGLGTTDISVRRRSVDEVSLRSADFEMSDEDGRTREVCVLAEARRSAGGFYGRLLDGGLARKGKEMARSRRIVDDGDNEAGKRRSAEDVDMIRELDDS